MAKTKKLNKRVILLIAVFTIIIAAAAGVYIWTLPNDPTVFAQQAKDAMAKSPKAYGEAVKAYGKAIATSEGEQQADYQFDQAKVFFEWANELGLSPSQRRDYNAQGRNLLRVILQRHPKYMKAHRLDEEKLWDIFSRSIGSLEGQKVYLERVDKILELEDDAELYARRSNIKQRLSVTDPTYKDQAIDDIRKAIALKPSKAEYWQQWARFLSYLGQDENAEQVYKEGVKANPKNAAFLISYSDYLRSQQRMDQAFALLREAIALQPDNTLGYLKLAELYLLDKQYKEAIDAVAQARKIDPNDVQAQAILSNIRRAEGDLQGSAQALRDALKMVDETPSDKAKLAQQFANRRNLNARLANILLTIHATSQDQAEKDQALAEARQCYEVVEKLVPDTYMQYMLGGQLASAEKDWNKARQYYEKAIALRSTPSLIMQLAQIYSNLRMPGLAESLLLNELEKPTLTDQERVACLALRVPLLIDRRAYALARECAENVLKVQPDNERIKQMLESLDVAEGKIQDVPKDNPVARQMQNRLIQELVQKEEYDTAIEMLQKLYAENPDDDLLLRNLVLVLNAAGRQDDAIELVRKVQKASPDKEGLKEYLLLVEEKDPAKRFELEMQFADQEPDPLKKALAKMILSNRAGKYEDVKKYLKEAEEIDPDNFQVINAQFRIAMQEKDWDQAKKLAERIGEKEASSGEMMKAQVLIQEQRSKDVPEDRDYAPAISILEKEVQAKPYLSKVRLLLAECYMNSKQPEKAREQLEACVRQNRQDVNAMVALARLAAFQGNLEEQNKWVRLAYQYPAGKLNPYIRELYLRQEIDTKDIGQAIAEREKIFEKNKGNLENALRLASLYERNKQNGKAQEMFEYVYKATPNKIAVVGMLADFYRRNKQASKADALFGELLKQAKDSQAKAAVYVRYGNFLQNFDPATARAMYEKAVEVAPEDIAAYGALSDLSAGEAVNFARQGKTSQSQAKWQESLDTIKKIVEMQPDNVKLKEVLYRRYLDAGLIDEALFGFQKLSEADPESARALVGLGLTQMKKNNLVEAESLFKKALQLQSDNVDAHVGLSGIYQAQGDILSAIEELKQARQLRNDPGMEMDLAKLYLAMGQLEEAAGVYTAIIEENDSYFPAYQQLINLSGRQEKWIALEKLVAQGKEKFPESPDFDLALAQMWLRRGDQGKTLQALESAFKLAPNNVGIVRQYLGVLAQSGMNDQLISESEKYLNNPDHKSGVMALRAQVQAKQQPDSAEAFNQFLQALKQIKNPEDVFFVMKLMIGTYGLDKTLAKSSDIINTLPDEWRVLLVLGDCSERLGKSVEAEDYYKKALSLCKDENSKVFVLQKQAYLYSKLNKPRETEKVYTQMIELQPDSVAALNNLAYLYVDVLDQPDKALPLIQRAMQIQPGNMNLIDTYAWTLAKLGRLDEARNALMKLINKNITGADILYHLGYVLEKTGDLQDAQDYYRKAIDAIGNKKGHPLLATIQAALDRVDNALNQKE